MVAGRERNDVVDGYRRGSTYRGPAFLEKVWENLFSNALKYTRFGGAIEIVLTDQ